jgi:UDP-glucose:(heptosyl)LPS alpha-1,3-glucosyltransferase
MLNLSERGHDVHIVGQNIPAEITRLPVVVHRLVNARTALKRAEAAEAILRGLDLDLIHDMGLGWYCDIFQPHDGCWPAITRQKLLSMPHWLQPIKRHIDSWLPRYRQIQELSKRRAGKNNFLLLAVSHKVAAEFKKHYRIPQKRIRVIYNGVDVDHFSPRRRAELRQSVRQKLGISPDTLLAISVAHNFRLKGIPTLLKAMEIIKSENLPFHAVVVGGRNLQSWRLWARIRRLPVTFVGTQPDTMPFYAAADMLVHPSFYDSCSLVLLESAACGLPMLVSRENGAAELLTDGIEGLLLNDASDAGRLAAQMKFMLDPDTRKRMGSAARRLAVKHTFQHNFDEIIAIYQQIKEDKRRYLESVLS